MLVLGAPIIRALLVIVMPLGVKHGLTSFEFGRNGIVALLSIGSMIACTFKTLKINKKSCKK
jgi:hypothetical protein